MGSAYIKGIEISTPQLRKRRAPGLAKEPSGIKATISVLYDGVEKEVQLELPIKNQKYSPITNILTIKSKSCD